MKYLIFALCFIGIILFKKDSEAQQAPCEKYYDKTMRSFVYTSVDEMPEYPGGYGNFSSFFATRVKYDTSNSETLQGKVTLVFIVDTLGNVRNAGIYKKLAKDNSRLEKEYLSVLTKTLKWKPGRCNGKKVPVRFIAPFLINLQK
ncbi:hypothetical protein ABIE26_004060 [Pedobacter africanus]|uniref:Uncharacterized protein n=1 Tax=Pedobacter africanus TaxID=151894 RepID=A0ACC6L136_9SPHI|nr:energy transducer TonB [Pedobacter africanus]MDR6785350.1 hypothetical protein [Pedobacter africanus]